MYWRFYKFGHIFKGYFSYIFVYEYIGENLLLANYELYLKLNLKTSYSFQIYNRVIIFYPYDLIDKLTPDEIKCDF